MPRENKMNKWLLLPVNSWHQPTDPSLAPAPEQIPALCSLCLMDSRISSLWRVFPQALLRWRGASHHDQLPPRWPRGSSALQRSVLVLLVTVGALAGFSSADAASPSRLQSEADIVIQSVLTLEPALPKPDRVPVASGTGALSIFRAVQITLCNNPALRTQREVVHRLAFEVRNARREFQPKWHAGASVNASESSIALNGERSTTNLFNGSQTVGVSQRLPFGGEISLDAGGALNSGNDQNLCYSPSAAISLRLPLLRGFGIDVNSENLVQKKRNVLYALRGLKLQEEEVVLRTIESYLDLLTAKERIRELEQRKESADHLYKQARTFFELGQTSELEVVQTEQQSLRADRDLKTAKTDYGNRLDDFKVLLNLPVGAALELEEYRPPQIALPMDGESLVRAALCKRADLQTIADVVEDKRRQMRLADKSFKPDLDLIGRAATASSAASNLSALSQDYSVGFAFSFPLDRDPENLNLLNAFQELQQAERGQRLAQEAIESGVRGGLRVLQNVEEALQLEAQIIAAAERRLRLAQIQFESGLVSSREVVDAQNELLGEQVRRLDLCQRRFVGILRLRSAVGGFEPDLAPPRS